MDLASFNALIRFYRVTHRTANLLAILRDYPELTGQAHTETQALAPMWTQIDKIVGKHVVINSKTLGAGTMKRKALTAVEIYASNHAVAAAAAQMSENIENLHRAGLIETEEAQRRLAIIEEIRALTNLDVGSNMAAPELNSATAAQQKKLAIERKWKEGDTDAKPMPKPAPHQLKSGKEDS